MGKGTSKYLCGCPPRCACCGERKSDSYDLKVLPRPPRLASTNGEINFNFSLDFFINR